MHERSLGPGMRLLLGVIGATALGAGVAVGATELCVAYLGAPLVPALAVALVRAVVAVVRARVLLGAARGRIAVRRPAGGRWSR